MWFDNSLLLIKAAVGRIEKRADLVWKFETTSLSAALQLVSKAPPHNVARSNSFFSACFSSMVTARLCRVSRCWQRTDGQFSHCLVVRWLFVFHCVLSLRRGGELPAARAGAVMETPSDTDCCDSVAVDSNGFGGSRWSQRSLIFFHRFSVSSWQF